MSSSRDFDDAVAKGLLSALRNLTGIAELALDSGIDRMLGGMDTDTFAFSLSNAPENLSGDMILRLFRTSDQSHRVVSESAIQNLAASGGHPVPEVPINSAGELIAGRPFLVMRRVPGVTLLDVLSGDPMGASEPAAKLMGRTQARLHDLDAHVAMRALNDAGLNPESYTPLRLLADVQKLAELTGDKAIVELGRWLQDRAPIPPERPSVCHGDFHPANIIVQDFHVRGLIDWSNFLFGHSEFDVAATRFIVSISPLDDPPVPLDQLRPMLDRFLSMYEQAYTEIREIDPALVGYYTVLRAGHALAKTIAARYGSDVPGAAHDAYGWSRPAVHDAIKKLVLAETGIDADAA